MTVKELILELEQCDQESVVYVQVDSEGNGYCRARGADGSGVLDPSDNPYRPESIHHEERGAEEACMEDDEWEEALKKRRVVVIYP